MSIPGKRRGRPPGSTHAADESILKDWHAAQVAGNTRKEFAARHAMSVDELERIVQRASKRVGKSGIG